MQRRSAGRWAHHCAPVLRQCSQRLHDVLRLEGIQPCSREAGWQGLVKLHRAGTAGQQPPAALAGPHHWGKGGRGEMSGGKQRPCVPAGAAPEVGSSANSSPWLASTSVAMCTRLRSPPARVQQHRVSQTKLACVQPLFACGAQRASLGSVLSAGALQHSPRAWQALPEPARPWFPARFCPGGSHQTRPAPRHCPQRCLPPL